MNSSLARILTQIHVLERECKLKEAIKNLLDKTRKGIKGKIQDEAIDQVITQQKEQKITLSNLKYSQCQAQELTQNVIDGQSQNKNQVQKTDIVQLVEEISKAKSQEDIRGILKKVRQGCNLSNVCELIDNLKKEIEQKKLAVQKLKQKENSNTAEESTRKYLPNQYQFHTAYCKLDQKVTKENLSRESFVAGTVVDAIQQEIKKLETQKSMDTLAQLRIITLYGDLQRAKAQEREINRLEAWATNGMSKKQTRLLDDIIQRHDSLQYDTLIYN